MLNQANSESLFAQAKTLFPGGVNSPVRAFRNVGGTPVFVAKGAGAFFEDEDNNRYLDFVLAWGPLVLGHAHPLVVEAISNAAQYGTCFGAPTVKENQLASLIIDTFPSIETVRFTSSGTESCMTAVRLARGYTKRPKIVKFAGCYHGHSQNLLGDSVAEADENTIVLPYNDLEAVSQTFAQQGADIAALIVEPVVGNMGLVLPKADFLPGLQNICQNYGALFIVDEVITGFRAHKDGGAQQLFNLDPDITCLGKIVGGGTPLAALGGKKHIMQTLSPTGPVFHGGTLSGNPISVAAGYATVHMLRTQNIHEPIEQLTAQFIEGINNLAYEHNVSVQANSVGSIFGLYFLKKESPALTNPVYDLATAQQYVDTKRYAHFFHFMLNNSIYFAPSAFEAGFLSAAHTAKHVQHTLEVIEKYFKLIAKDHA